MEWDLSAHFGYSCRLLETFIRLLLQSKVVTCTMHFNNFIATLASWLKIQPYNHGNLRRPECIQTGTFCTCPGKVDWCFLSDDTHDYKQGNVFPFPQGRTATDVLVKPCELKACSWKSRLPCKQLPYRNHA